MTKSEGLRVEKDEVRFEAAQLVTLVLVFIAVFLAYVLTSGAGFTPRNDAIDGLAGLAIGAFVVDRLLPFIPPWSATKVKGLTGEARKTAVEGRKIDIESLRWGFGAVLGLAFVALTGLGAVEALTGQKDVVNEHVDRVIAVLAIAGGVKGLATINKGLNPPDDEEEEAAPAQGGEDPELGWLPYVLGVVALVVAALLTLIWAGKTSGIELTGSEAAEDGTIGLVLRFGPLLVAAVVVQQLVERTFGSSITGPGKKLMTAAVTVILGVIAAGFMHLYLLHNVGFFGTGSFVDVLKGSSDTERMLDLFLTGVAIAAGTAPLHDLSAGIKKRTGTK
jgi:hypothetical protein